jgi:hypothetical protein
MMSILVPCSRKMRTPFLKLSFLIIFIMLFASCKQKPAYQANISDVKIDPVEVKRYEKLLFSLDPDRMREQLEPYHQEFFVFLGDEINTDEGQQQLQGYITNAFNREVYNDTRQVWDDVSTLEKKLTEAFRYFHYHFPDRNLPEVYSYISGIDFEHPVYYQSDVVAIGLDMFLGRDYVNYDKVSIPAFKRVRFVPEAVPVEVMRAMGRDILMQSPSRPQTMLDFMIFEGKLLYIVDAMLPQYPDSLKAYYTTVHNTWAQRNEGYSWTFILNNEMLYNTDRQLIQKFVGDTPFTAPFSNASAPRMGQYHGWQIVREYMRRNPSISINELIFEKTDSREILAGSKYKPGR